MCYNSFRNEGGKHNVFPTTRPTGARRFTMKQQFFTNEHSMHHFGFASVACKQTITKIIADAPVSIPACKRHGFSPHRWIVSQDLHDSIENDDFNEKCGDLSDSEDFRTWRDAPVEKQIDKTGETIARLGLTVGELDSPAPPHFDPLGSEFEDGLPPLSDSERSFYKKKYPDRF